MKRFFTLIIAASLFIGSTLAVDRVTDQHRLPTIIDAIHAIMRTNNAQSIDLNRLPGLSAESINNCDRQGWTLLSCAIYKNFDSIVTQLQQHGAKIEWSIIHAIEYDNDVALEPLLQIIQHFYHTVDILLSHNGHTPLACAIACKSQKSIALLKRFGATLENAAISCINHRNRILFKILLKNSPQQESENLLSSLVVQSVSDLNNSSFFNNFRITAGNERVYESLLATKNQHPEFIEPINQNYITALQLVSIEIAIKHDSLEELNAAFKMGTMPMTIQDILKSALILDAAKIVSTCIHDNYFINLEALAQLLRHKNQDIVTDYLTVYMKRHHQDESLTTLKALYHAADKKKLPDVASECIIWLTYKINLTTVKSDDLETFKAIIAELESEQIYLELDVLLADALKENAQKILSWLCQEKKALLNLNDAIELMHSRNSECAQIYLDHHIKALQTCRRMADYGTDLLMLENELKQKVKELNIPALTQWYAQTMLPLVTQHIKAVTDCLNTLTNAEQFTVHRRKRF